MSECRAGQGGSSIDAGQGVGLGFAEAHFGAAQLGDRWRTRRLVHAAHRILEHPQGSLPDKRRSSAALKGLHRLVDGPTVTHQSVLRPHRERTRQRMREHKGVVLTLHDTTELDDTDITTRHANGQIGNGTHRGYAFRRTIEEYHKAKKTRCSIEDLQFTSETRLEPVMALLSVVALSLLQLRSASRQEDTPTRPAVEIMSKVHVVVLSGWRFGRVRMDLTVHEFLYALARVGVHQTAATTTCLAGSSSDAVG